MACDFREIAGYQNVGNPGEFPMKFHGNSLRNYQNVASWKIPRKSKCRFLAGKHIYKCGIFQLAMFDDIGGYVYIYICNYIYHQYPQFLLLKSAKNPQFAHHSSINGGLP
jgi:hypothetical protein